MTFTGAGQGRNKYGAIRTRIDGHTFDSKAEANYYAALKLRERAGEIGAIRVHPRYPLAVNGKLIATYVADFEYQVIGDGLRVDDVKGVATPVFKIKRKLFEALYSVPLNVVRAR